MEQGLSTILFEELNLPAIFPVFGSFCFVWLDTADVVWRTAHECLHQLVRLSLQSTAAATLA